MTARPGVDPADLRRLRKTLAPVPRSQRKRIANRGTKDAAWIVAKEARRLAPKSYAGRTRRGEPATAAGAGARAIKPRKYRSRDRSWFSYAVSAIDLAARATRAYYMLFQDLGWRQRSRRRGKMSGGERRRRRRSGRGVGRVTTAGRHFVADASANRGRAALAALTGKIYAAFDREFGRRPWP